MGDARVLPLHHSFVSIYICANLRLSRHWLCEAYLNILVRRDNNVNIDFQSGNISLRNTGITKVIIQYVQRSVLC